MSEDYGAALLVTPLEAIMPTPPKAVSKYIDPLIAMAMKDTVVIKAVDTTSEAEGRFRALYDFLRKSANSQGLRFTWSIYRSPSNRLHFQLTQIRFKRGR